MDVGCGEEGGGEDPGEERGSGVYEFRQPQRERYGKCDFG